MSINRTLGGHPTAMRLIRKRLAEIQQAHDSSEDRGSALVIAIASVVLTGLLMAVVLSSVVFSVGHTSASRAEAESRAAAEGGAQLLARYLMDQTVTDSFSCNTNWNSSAVDPSGGYVDYEVIDVSYKPSGGLNGPWINCNSGSTIPVLADALRIRTVGYAESVGVAGHKRGNSSAVEIAYVRPQSVSFDKAIFSNADANLNSDSYVNESLDGRPSDVVTNGVWKCSTQNVIEGSVYALGGGVASTNCKINGNLYVNGNFTVSNNVWVEGDLIVNGNLTVSSSGLRVKGRTLVVGTFNMGGRGTNDFTGEVRITKDLTGWESQASQAFKSKLFVGGQAFAGLWDRYNFVNGLNGENIQNVTSPNARLHTRWEITSQPWIVPDIMTNPDHEDRVFPGLTPEHEAFAGMAEANWNSITAGIGQGANSCSYWNYTAPIVINQPTKIDLTGCASVSFQDIDFILNDDLVIFFNRLNVTGPMTVRTSTTPNVPNPTLFLVSPSPSGVGEPTCTNSSNKEIRLSVQSWSQRDSDGVLRTKVFMYSTGKTYIASRLTDSFHGQLYGCEVNVESGVDMIFGKAGSSDQTDTLFDLRLDYVRELTDVVAP